MTHSGSAKKPRAVTQSNTPVRGFKRTAPVAQDAPLRIGDLAALAGVSADTLRYYERRKLLPPSRRTASGYREYAPEAAVVVHFIKHAQALGFALAEVEELLRLRSASGERQAGLAVRDVAVAKIDDIDVKMRMLESLRGALTDLVAACDRTCGAGIATTNVRECPIITALSGDAHSFTRPQRGEHAHAAHTGSRADHRRHDLP